MWEKSYVDVRVRKPEKWVEIFGEYRKAHTKLKKNILEKKKEIHELNAEITQLKRKIKRQEIQINTLTEELKKYTIK